MTDGGPGGDPEESLTGGAQSEGLVRVGDTVRSTAHDRTWFAQELLRHLERVGFSGAPRALGLDDSRRQVVSYVEGQVPSGPPFDLSDAQLVSASRLVRRFHDATARCPLADGHEVVCHGDLGPFNTVFRGDTAVALIDWGRQVRPGRRAEDFAHAVWCFADLVEPEVTIAEQARRAALMCAHYPGMSPALVVEELTARFRSALDGHRAGGRTGAVVVAFEDLLRWLDVHGPAIASA